MIVPIIIFCVAIIFSYMVYYGKALSYMPTINGPWNVPLIGIFYKFFDKTDVFNNLIQLHAKYGPTFRGYFINELRVFTKDPELIELVTTSRHTIDKSKNYKKLSRWLGNGIFIGPGKKWQTRRKMLTPAYHFNNLQQFIEVFDNHTNIMIDQLNKEVEKPYVDIQKLAPLCTLDIICEAAMGIQMHAQLDGASELVEATAFMTEVYVTQLFGTLKSIDFIYKLTDDYRREEAELKVLHEFTLNIIKQRRAELESSNKSESLKKNNFLDMLLKSTHKGPALTDEEIRVEVTGFTFGGHDTVSTAISFTLFLLSNHASVLDKLRIELTDIFEGDTNRSTTYDDLQKMKYLELVIKESLRMYTPGPFFSRHVSTDITYKGNIIPKGSTITINAFALHLDPKYYPEPEKFNPERFIVDGCDEQKNSPYAYIPFSAGYRNCLGQKFAWLEMKTIISKIIRNFEILPAVPSHVPLIQPGIVLRSGNGLLLRIKRIL